VTDTYERKEIVIAGGLDDSAEERGRLVAEMEANGWRYLGASGVPPYSTTKLILSRGHHEVNY